MVPNHARCRLRYTPSVRWRLPAPAHSIDTAGPGPSSARTPRTHRRGPPTRRRSKRRMSWTGTQLGLSGHGYYQVLPPRRPPAAPRAQPGLATGGRGQESVERRPRPERTSAVHAWAAHIGKRWAPGLERSGVHRDSYPCAHPAQPMAVRWAGAPGETLPTPTSPRPDIYVPTLRPRHPAPRRSAPMAPTRARPMPRRDRVRLIVSRRSPSWPSAWRWLRVWWRSAADRPGRPGCRLPCPATWASV